MRHLLAFAMSNFDVTGNDIRIGDFGKRVCNPKRINARIGIGGRNDAVDTVLCQLTLCRQIKRYTPRRADMCNSLRQFASNDGKQKIGMLICESPYRRYRRVGAIVCKNNNFKTPWIKRAAVESTLLGKRI